MKIQCSNKLISILNAVIGAFFSIFIFILINNLIFETSMLGVYEEGEKLLIIQNIMLIIIFLVNIINVIINKKNIKYIIWSLIPIIFFVEKFFINLDFVIYNLWLIIPITIFIIALIIEILKNKRKKNIIFYILAIILSIIIFSIDEIKDYVSYIWLIISSIMMFIYSKGTVNDNKAKRIIVVILLGILIISATFYIAKTVIMIVKLYEIDGETVEFIEQIKEGLENEQSEDMDLLLVNRDNKWGYINKNGEEIIPCQYDVISDYNSMFTFHKILIAKRGNIYDILSRSGKILATIKGKPLPFVNKKAEEELLKESENDYTYFLMGIQNILYICMDEYDKLEASAFNLGLSISSYIMNYPYEDYYDKQYYIKPVPYSYNEKSNVIYKYNLKNGDNLYVEELENNEGKKKYNIKVERNNQIIETIENVQISFNYISGEEGAISTYISGDIPFKDIEKEVQGYYSIDEGMAKFLEGKYQILDKKDNLIIIRDYNNPNNIRDYIMNSNTGEVIYIARNISAYQYGYIIQKYNDKVVYLNNDLKEITEEFDIIYLIEGGEVLICGNNSNLGEYILYTKPYEEYISSEGGILNNREYSLYDTQGNKLTDYTYQVMKDELLNESYKGKYYVFDNYYCIE